MRAPARWSSITFAAALMVGAAGLLGAQDAVPFGSCRSDPDSRFGEATIMSGYIPMPDGIRLAADVILPRDLPNGTKVPVILTATRYWRGGEGTGPNSEQRNWVRYGYGVVSIDVRGTGASFGTWAVPWSPQEVKDLGEVVRWIAAQPWSTGRIGTIGTSYTANTAQVAAVAGNPALRAVIPRFMDWDVYTDLLAPGGVYNEFLGREWGNAVHAMDWNQKGGNPPRGVRPVDGDSGVAWLEAAVRDHKANPHIYEASKLLVNRDDKPPQWGIDVDTWSTHRYAAQLKESAVPIFGWAGWLDAGTSNGVINRFLSLTSVPQRVVIGPWGHGGGFHASPFRPADTPTDPSREQQAIESLCFFDWFVKAGEKGKETQREIVYYTLGEERWKSTSTWPPAGIGSIRMYLTQANMLLASPPGLTTGADSYTVNFEATTGTKNRWYTQLGGSDVIYPDRAESDKLLLTYTSAPLDRDYEVTGHPVVSLWLSSTHTDGNLFVYLEDVDEQGRVTYITEGQLRLLHRAESKDPPPYPMLTPYHSYKRKDAKPMAPGQVDRVHFALIPTSVLFRRGHRVRIAIGGADKDTFARNPETGTPTLTIERNAKNASYIELPIVPRG